MSNKNEINEIFSYISKNNEVPVDRFQSIYSAIYQCGQSNGTSSLSGTVLQGLTHTNVPPSKTITKSEFEVKFNEAVRQKNIEDELLYLFYNLDRERKGYLTPEDIMGMFRVLDKAITINEIENSFKYAKVYKNKMTFEDFKEYFHNY
jgi:Ca2+-binding EF-hand superfamily protein